MWYILWNDKSQQDGAMKMSRLFLSKQEFQNWYKKNRHKMKNVTVPIGSRIKRSDL